MLQSTLNDLGGLIWAMSTMAERIREAMGEMSPADLARAAKVTPGAVTQWLDGTTKSLRGEKAALLEAATGYRAAWIATGRGPKKVEGYVLLEEGDVTPEDFQLLMDFHAMLEDDRTRLAKEISMNAAKMRAHFAELQAAPHHGRRPGAPLPAEEPTEVDERTTARLEAEQNARPPEQRRRGL